MTPILGGKRCLYSTTVSFGLGSYCRAGPEGEGSLVPLNSVAVFNETAENVNAIAGLTD